MAHRGETHYVLVADDQVLFRRGVRTLLAAEPDLQVVAEASSFAEVAVKRKQTQPTVIVISASLLKGSAPAERKEVRDWIPEQPLLLISDLDQTGSANLAEEIGATLTIPRNTPASQIIAIIRRVAWKEDALEVTRTAADLNALAKVQGSKSSVLTSREQEVVKLLAEGRTVRETAAELSLSAKTIDAHKLNVMRKLDIHNREKLIEYAVSERIITPAAI